jgi:hypothetical protein
MVPALRRPDSTMEKPSERLDAAGVGRQDFPPWEKERAVDSGEYLTTEPRRVSASPQTSFAQPTLRRSTTKISVSSGPMTPPAPREP